MTYVQLMQEVQHLTPPEKFALVEALLRDLRNNIVSPLTQQPVKELTVAEKLKLVESLAGAFKPQDGTAPTDNEIQDDYTRYLITKYLGSTQ